MCAFEGCRVRAPTAQSTPSPSPLPILSPCGPKATWRWQTELGRTEVIAWVLACGFFAHVAGLEWLSSQASNAGRSSVSTSCFQWWHSVIIMSFKYTVLLGSCSVNTNLKYHESLITIKNTFQNQCLFPTVTLHLEQWCADREGLSSGAAGAPRGLPCLPDLFPLCPHMWLALPLLPSQVSQSKEHQQFITFLQRLLGPLLEAYSSAAIFIHNFSGPVPEPEYLQKLHKYLINRTERRVAVYGMYDPIFASFKSCAFFDYRNLLIVDNWEKNAKLSWPLTP